MHNQSTKQASGAGKLLDSQQMHVCRLCDKLLSSSSSLDRHMLTHSGERPFVCKRCHMTFTTNGNMHRHMRTHLHKDSLARQQQEQQLKSLLGGPPIRLQHSPAAPPLASAGLEDAAKFSRHHEQPPFPQHHLLQQQPQLQQPQPQQQQPPLDAKTLMALQGDHQLSLESVKAFMLAAAAAAAAVSQQHQGWPSPFPAAEMRELENLGLGGASPSGAPGADHLQQSRGKRRKQVNPRSTRAPSVTVVAASEGNLEDEQDEECADVYGIDLNNNDDADDERELELEPGADNNDENNNTDDQFDGNNRSAASAEQDFNNNLDQDDYIGAERDNTSDNNNNDSDHSSGSSGAGASSSRSTSSQLLLLHHHHHHHQQHHNQHHHQHNQPRHHSSLSRDAADIKLSSSNASNNSNNQPHSEIIVNDDDDNLVDDDVTRHSAGLADEIVEDISQSYVKTANPNAARKGGKRNRHCYKCKLCTYSSVDRCTLVRHLRIHSGERPYICGICRYAFTTKANCERHVRKRHKKQYNSLGGAGGVKGSNGGGRSLIITDHSNHQTIPIKVNPVAAQTISQTLQRIQEKQQETEEALDLSCSKFKSS